MKNERLHALVMEKVKRIYSDCDNRIIEIVKDNDGSYLLHEFARKYDAEEEVTYEIRVLSNLGGRYGYLSSAIEEAKRVLGVL